MLNDIKMINLPLNDNIRFSVILLISLCFWLQQGFAQPGQVVYPLEAGNPIETVIDFNNSNQIPDLKYTFNDSEWHYIAFTKTISDEGTLFVNGESVGNINWNDISYDHFVFNIAASFFSSYSGFFSGTIDEIRISNELKTESELKAHFNSNQSFSSEPNTAVIWKFDEGSGNKFTNLGGDKTGTLYGEPLWVDGKFGKAVKYDGIDDRGRITIDLLEYSVTYELWVKFDGEIRETIQTIIQPYGSLSSIELQVRQTATEPEPPVAECVVASLSDVPVSCTSTFLKAGIRIEIDMDASTDPGPFEAYVASASDPDNGATYQIPDNGVRTILNLEKDSYNVQISSTTDESCSFSGNIDVFGGADPVEFEILEIDNSVNCKGDVGSIKIVNVTGDPDIPYSVQLLDESNNILETYEVEQSDLEGGFVIDANNTEKLTAGEYYVKLIQNQEECAGASAVSELITINQGVCSEPQSEVYLSLPETLALSGQELIVPVSVSGFENILTMQFTVDWDPAMLEFVQVQDFGISELNGNSFNLFEPGKLTCSWTPTDLLSVTLDNQTIIFNVIFNVIGDGGSLTSLSFVDDPTVREVANGEGDILTVVYTDGLVTVQDEVQLEGYIKTQKGEPLANVEVMLTGAKEETVMTDAYGKYYFSVVPGLDYVITPNENGSTQADAGVTTLDLVVMQWHILGMKFLMSDYDLIACDVNNSRSLTMLDVAQTRAVILHINDAFEGRYAVEFISHDYAGNPDKFDFENSISITPSGSQSDLNFTVVKLGDATTNWSVNQGNGRNQDLKKIEFQLEKGISTDGNIDLALKANELNEMIGLQFTLEWDPDVMRYIGLGDDQMSFDVNSRLIEQGKLAVLWNSERPNGLNLMEGDILSSFEFEKLSDADPKLTIGSSVTPALAYNAGLESYRISSSVLNNELNNTQLSIYPNPVQGVLNIQGVLNGQSHYSILDATGKIMSTGALSPQIEVGHLKTGMYLLRIENKHDQIINKKFLKF